MWDHRPHQHSPIHPPPPCLKLEDYLRIKSKTDLPEFEGKKKIRLHLGSQKGKESTTEASQGGLRVLYSGHVVTTLEEMGLGAPTAPSGKCSPFSAQPFLYFGGGSFPPPPPTCSYDPLNAWAAGVQPHTPNPPILGGEASPTPPTTPRSGTEKGQEGGFPPSADYKLSISQPRARGRAAAQPDVARGGQAGRETLSPALENIKAKPSVVLGNGSETWEVRSCVRAGQWGRGCSPSPAFRAVSAHIQHGPTV